MADPTVKQRKMFAKMGLAMPDGSYYIRPDHPEDLQNAIDSVGRAAGSDGTTDDEKRNAVRQHIIKRAKALGKASAIPDTWNSDGTLKHDFTDLDLDAFMMHFGVKGMRWGVRRGSSSSKHPVSDDAARAKDLATTVKKHGVSALSNTDLQHLVTRLNLEGQHSKLNPAHVSAGKKTLDTLLGVGGNVAKQQATAYANKYAAQGIEHLINQATAAS